MNSAARGWDRRPAGLPLVLLLAALVSVAAGCDRFHKPAETAAAAPAEPEPVPVTVAPVAAQPVDRTVSVVGTLFGDEEVVITPKVEGRVQKIHHDLGDVVHPGDVLLDLDPTDLQLTMSEAKKSLELELAKLGLAELPGGELELDRLPTVVRARTMEENALRKLDRIKRARGGGAATQDEFDQTETDLKVARATREQALLDARATLASARHKLAVLQTAEQKRRDCRVTVPEPTTATRDKNGGPVEYRIAQRMASEGEMVRAFPSTAVFRLVKDQPLKLKAAVPERHIGDVQVGQHAMLRVEAYPDRLFWARVSRLNPTVDPVNRTFQIEALVNNGASGGPRRLRAGGFARADILVGRDPGALLVPIEAVVSFVGVLKVFVLDGGKVREVEVKVGVQPAAWAEGLASEEQPPPAQYVGVPRGFVEVRPKEAPKEAPGRPAPALLAAGARVVVTGQSKLADSTPVRVRDDDTTQAARVGGPAPAAGSRP